MECILNFVFPLFKRNESDREVRLKSIHAKITASQAAKTPGRYKLSAVKKKKNLRNPLNFEYDSIM